MKMFSLIAAEMKKVSQKYLPEMRYHQGIPGIEITSNGRLYACYYGRRKPGGEGAGNFAIVATSDDKGLSWNEDFVIAAKGGNERVFDPVLWYSPDGFLRLFWSQCVCRKTCPVFDGRSGVWMSVCEKPDGTKPEWSDPRRIADGVMMNKPTVLANGSWALPVSIWGSHPAELTAENKKIALPNILYTNDGAKSFRLVKGPDIPDRNYDEHAIIELKDGKLWHLCRTRQGIAQAFSKDKGENWEIKDGFFMRGPSSRFAIRRLKSGKLCLVYHQIAVELPGEKMKGRGERKMLTAWLSDDDGKSWYGRLVIDYRTGVSYPDIAEGNEGFIYIIYDHARTYHGQILVAKVSEQDIAMGELVTPGAYLSNLVSCFTPHE
jgi:BNR repeat-like domain